MNNDFMIDLETLATEPDACVISIGICAFNLEQKIVASEGWAISSKDWHGAVNPDTVKWWMGQNEAAREYSFKGTTASLEAALSLYAFINKYASKDSEFWANDPDFDIVILKKWWARVEKHHHHNLPLLPIRYNMGRSCRTIYSEARRLMIPYDHMTNMASVAHNPVDDACNQARTVIQIRNNLVGAAA